ncbi:MAG: outer membrane protein assembly factor BamC [Candidatus Woesearchaeota archaeon]
MLFNKYFHICILFISLIGCSTTEEIFDDITAPDYVNSSKARRLEVPPDLSELETSTGYNVPGEAKSYKDYVNREEELASILDNPNRKKVIENPEWMKIVKSGNLRWLEVKKNPDVIWPHVKDFWEDLGFRVLVANRRTGIIETEWMDTDDIKIDRADTGVLSTFDKWLDSLSGFSDKRKFRTRVEFGENGNTEIYISQRSAEAAADQHAEILRTRDSGYNPSTVYKIEEYKSDNLDNKKKLDIKETREIDDYEIDSELLTRLMIKLGASSYDAKSKVDAPEIIVKSSLIETADDTYIVMNDPFDRSWRRLGLALDIIGFVTEDKNRSEGIYFVRFSQEDLPEESIEEESGLIDSLIFWDHDQESKEIVKKEKDKLVRNEEENFDPNEPSFTGIEAPEVKPIDEDYIPEELSKETPMGSEEETWVSKLWPSWGDDDNSGIIPNNEKRYRIRIKPTDNSNTIVYIDFSNGKKNNSKEARKVLTILNEYLK